MIFIPDSYDYNQIDNKFDMLEDFYKCQKKYKIKFEELFCRLIDFDKIERYIEEQDVEIPVVEDKDYNFYHSYSGINSKYIYVRNNYHIENLSIDDLNKIKQDDLMDDNFLLKTYRDVIYEDGEIVFMGAPIYENAVNSKSLVFEFAFDQKKCESLEQLNKIHKIIEFCFKMIKEECELKINENLSFVVYEAIPDLFYNGK